MSRSWPYDDRTWRKLRRVILHRDGYLCRIQLPGCTTHADVVDHIIPLNDGGPFLDPTNLQAACNHCNVSKRHRGRGEGPTSERWY